MAKTTIFAGMFLLWVVLSAGAQQAPELSLTDLGGKPVYLADLRGKVVLLNFWATWCPPCRAEMPSLDKLYGFLKDDPRFVILAVDIQEDPARVGAFVAAQGYRFRILLDRQGQTAGAYGIEAIPTTFLLGPDGKILDRTTGGSDWSAPSLVKKIRALLKEKS